MSCQSSGDAAAFLCPNPGDAHPPLQVNIVRCTQFIKYMYVCKNTYIQEQDIADLLNTCPARWQIREATLLAIADLYLTMDITVFRLSLLQAVRQEQEGKTPVRHHNAWLKAAFVKNGGQIKLQTANEDVVLLTHKETPIALASIDGHMTKLLRVFNI